MSKIKTNNPLLRKKYENSSDGQLDMINDILIRMEYETARIVIEAIEANICDTSEYRLMIKDDVHKLYIKVLDERRRLVPKDLESLLNITARKIEEDKEKPK